LPACPGGTQGGKVAGNQNILKNGQIGDQIELLENKSYVFAAESIPFRPAKVIETYPVDGNPA
jgi:hypothetical protein